LATSGAYSGDIWIAGDFSTKVDVDRTTRLSFAYIFGVSMTHTIKLFLYLGLMQHAMTSSALRDMYCTCGKHFGMSYFVHLLYGFAFGAV